MDLDDHHVVHHNHRIKPNSLFFEIERQPEKDYLVLVYSILLHSGRLILFSRRFSLTLTNGKSPRILASALSDGEQFLAVLLHQRRGVYQLHVLELDHSGEGNQLPDLDSVAQLETTIEASGEVEMKFGSLEDSQETGVIQKAMIRLYAGQSEGKDNRFDFLFLTTEVPDCEEDGVDGEGLVEELTGYKLVAV